MSTSYRVHLAGNPNVGKSTVFNALTGLKQHTGNWSGKTVELASGSFPYRDSIFHLQDLPGTYSLISNSPEEEVAKDAICTQNPDLVLVVADATCLARNLNLLLQILEITPKVALCVNLLDEANRKKIFVNLTQLEQKLRIPVIGISAHKRKDILKLKEFISSVITNKKIFSSNILVTYPQPVEDAIQMILGEIPKECPSINNRFLSLRLLEHREATDLFRNMLSDDSLLWGHLQHAATNAKTYLSDQGISNIVLRDIVVESLIHRSKQIAEDCIHVNKKREPLIRLPDRIITSRWLGIPIMLSFLALLLWITIAGANIPSNWLMTFFLWLKPKFTTLFSGLTLPAWTVPMLMDGIYQTVTWVTAVMLPPMLIFFPLFTLLEDLGFLPRLAFNLDCCFKKSGGCGKQALTMCKEKFKMFLQHNL